MYLHVFMFLAFDMKSSFSYYVLQILEHGDIVYYHRQKSGIWGFRSEKVEQINGYSAKVRLQWYFAKLESIAFGIMFYLQVFTATGLNINTNTRVEHLPESEKKKQKSVSPLQDFLGAAQNQASNMPSIESPEAGSIEECPHVLGPRLTMEQYFTQPNNTTEPDGEVVL